MRLPESVTDLAPVGAVLKASEKGEELLRAAGETVNARLLVSEADEQGLSRWERDYGLRALTGETVARRRARIAAALAGGQTLTRERLAALAVSVGGAERGEVTEDFAAHTVELTLIEAGSLPEESAPAALGEMLARQKPAHLVMTVLRGADLTLERTVCLRGGGVIPLYGEIK